MFATDRGTYVVQGWKVPDRTATVEIPPRLMGYLEPHTCLSTRLQDTGRGSFLVYGNEITDAQILSQMDIPEHETCVEVAEGKAATEGSWIRGTAAG